MFERGKNRKRGFAPLKRPFSSSPLEGRLRRIFVSAPLKYPVIIKGVARREGTKTPLSLTPLSSQKIPDFYRCPWLERGLRGEDKQVR
jgi:hypothetical protein